MGYTTDFNGEFMLHKPLAPADLEFLQKLNRTRRMARNVDAKYGVEGEFYVEDTEDMGQVHSDNIIDYNRPPSTQPGIWCGWTPNDTGTIIEWDGGEKFYNYIEWIKYIIDNILIPRGYSLTGEVFWTGEDGDDRGKIVIKNNKIKILDAYTFFSAQLPQKRKRIKRTPLEEIAWIEKRILELKTKKKKLVNG